MNIWQDPEAARFVAGHRDGNETVPTAVTGAGVMVVAEPEAIKAHLSSSTR
ncbi:MAG: hypothetical protein WBM50_23745 [Acidimicrobiales bacterium]